MAASTIQYPYFHEEHNGASAYSQHDGHIEAPVWSHWYSDVPPPMMPIQTFWQPANNSALQSPLEIDTKMQQQQQQLATSPLTASPSSFINPDSLHSDSTPDTDPSSVAESEEYSGSRSSSSSKRQKTSRSPRRDSQRVQSPQHSIKHSPKDTTVRRKSVSEPVRRERNRTAAAKCRAKGKVAEEELKESQRAERERNLLLRAQFEELNNETLLLKHKLLSHSECSHPVIDKYLMREADKISRGYGHT